MEGDGIYSRYLDQYTLSGRFKFMVTIDDNDNNAFYISKANIDTTNNHYNSLLTKRKRLNMLHRQQQQQNSSQRETNHSPSKRYPVSSKEQQIPNYSDIMLQVTKKRCCGSTVLPSLQLHNFPQKAIKTGIFRRTVHGPVVHMMYSQDSLLKQDMMPPSKIGDLRIIRLPNTSDKLLASWTAPGGNFDVGSVSSYRFVYSSNIADLIDTENGNPKILLGFERMEKAGTKARFDFSFPHHNRDYYIGAYAFDLAGNRGKISNLVHIRIPAPPSAGGVLGEGKLYGSNNSGSNAIFDGQTEPNWTMIGVIAGVIGVLLLLGLAIISYYFAVARKRSKGKTGSTSSVMNGGSSDETDSSSFDSDIKNIMANPLGPSLPLPSSHSNNVQKYQQRNQHHQINSLHNNSHQQHHHYTAGGVGNGRGQVSSLNNTPSDNTTKTASTAVTPVYWSASQLLSKLDQPVHSNGFGQYSQNYGNPYVNSVQTDVYSVHEMGENNGGLAYAPHGPHSLQPMLSPSSLLTQHNHHHHSHQQHNVNGGLLSVGGSHNNNTSHNIQNGPNSLHNVSFADTRSYAMLHNNNTDWAYPPPHSSSVTGLSSAQLLHGSHNNKQEYHLDSPSHHQHCIHPEIPEEYTITVGNLNGETVGVDGETARVMGSIDSPNITSQTPTPKSSTVNNESNIISQMMSMKPRNITQV